MIDIVLATHNKDKQIELSKSLKLAMDGSLTSSPI